MSPATLYLSKKIPQKISTRVFLFKIREKNKNKNKKPETAATTTKIS